MGLGGILSKISDLNRLSISHLLQPFPHLPEPDQGRTRSHFWIYLVQVSKLTIPVFSHVAPWNCSIVTTNVPTKLKLDLKPSNCTQPRTSHPAFLNKGKKKVNLWRNSFSNRSSDIFNFKKKASPQHRTCGRLQWQLEGRLPQPSSNATFQVVSTHHLAGCENFETSTWCCE